MRMLIAVLAVLMLLGLSGCENMRGQGADGEPAREAPSGY
jgi:predicted small secreted protein